MNILIIGSGGREHAISRSFSKSVKVTRLFCASGNAGIAEIAECVPIRPEEIVALADFAAANAIDLTYVGGETALSLGIVDEFDLRGLRIVGPSRKAAQLEASKSFAKDFMTRNGVPTAKFVTAHSPVFAVTELESGNLGDVNTPVVVKADGLAAGKGVVVAANRAEAVAAINEMADLVGSAAADKIVLEECLTGHEVSLLMFADGQDFALMPPVRDHKRIGEGDTGPNTGGMGTITAASLLTPEELRVITDKMIRPTLRGCEREGLRFRGVLFLGLMMTPDGPKLLEYNVRFGDPETQAILVRLDTDLVDICEAMLNGRLAELEIKWREGSSACVILASEGYPAQPRTGDVIIGLTEAANTASVDIFHSGTAFMPPDAKAPTSATVGTDAPTYITDGGRVLGITATAGDPASALSAAYAAVAKITWPGMQFRQDIGKNCPAAAIT